MAKGRTPLGWVVVLAAAVSGAASGQDAGSYPSRPVTVVMALLVVILQIDVAFYRPGHRSRGAGSRRESSRRGLSSLLGACISCELSPNCSGR